MYHIISEEDRKRNQEAQAKELERSMEEARERAEQREAWRKSHPRCPHCGYEPPLPPWLMY